MCASVGERRVWLQRDRVRVYVIHIFSACWSHWKYAINLLQGSFELLGKFVKSDRTLSSSASNILKKLEIKTAHLIP